MTFISKEWDEKYYPVPAEDVDWVELGDGMTAAASWLKWTGLQSIVDGEWEGIRPEKDDHGFFDVYVERENKITTIGSSSCSLCVMVLSLLDGLLCEECPYFEFFGERCYIGRSSAYLQWLRLGDPEPMVKDLGCLAASLLGQMPSEDEIRAAILGAVRGDE